MDELKASPGGALGTGRIQILSDGIFAIAMTVLVLDVRPPVVASDADLPAALAAMAPRFASYALSFIVLGVYWTGHHNTFSAIRRTDRAFLWLNIVFLGFVAFIPFTTSLLASYPGATLPVALYGLHLTVIRLLLYLNWRYASWGHRLLDPAISPGRVRLVSRRILVGSVICMAGVVISPFAAGLSLVLYGLMVLFYVLPGTIDAYLNPSASAGDIAER
jgi:uncharacterized membrane protein